MALHNSKLSSKLSLQILSNAPININKDISDVIRTYIYGVNKIVYCSFKWRNFLQTNWAEVLTKLFRHIQIKQSGKTKNKHSGRYDLESSIAQSMLFSISILQTSNGLQNNPPKEKCFRYFYKAIGQTEHTFFVISKLIRSNSGAERLFDIGKKRYR